MSGFVISLKDKYSKDSMEYYVDKINKAQKDVDSLAKVYTSFESAMRTSGQIPNREFYKQVSSLESVAEWHTHQNLILPRHTSLESFATTRGYMSRTDLKVSMEGILSAIGNAIKRLIEWIKGLFGFGKKQEDQTKSIVEATKANINNTIASVINTNAAVNKAVQEIAKEIIEEYKGDAANASPAEVKQAEQQAVQEVGEVVEEKVKEAVEEQSLNVSSLVIGNNRAIGDAEILSNMDITYKNLAVIASQANEQISFIGHLLQAASDYAAEVIDSDTHNEEDASEIYKNLADGLHKQFVKLAPADKGKYEQVTKGGAPTIDFSSVDNELLVSPIILAGNRQLAMLKSKPVKADFSNKEEYLSALKDSIKNVKYLVVVDKALAKREVIYKYSAKSDLSKDVERLEKNLTATVDKIRVPSIKGFLDTTSENLEQALKKLTSDHKDAIGENVRYAISCLQIAASYLATCAVSLRYAMNTSITLTATDFQKFFQGYASIRVNAAKQILAAKRSKSKKK